MRTTLLALLCLLQLSVFAQSNISLTIFNNGGQQFFVIMNGIKQNAIPKTNVKVGGMAPGSYEIKLIFADGKTGDINKKIWIDADGDYLARVVMKGKKSKLQYFGVTNQDVPLPAGSESINYRPDEQTVYSDNTQAPIQSTQGTDAMSGQTSQPTTVTQGTPVYTNGTSVSSGMTPTSVQTSTTTQTGNIPQETSSTVTMSADPNYGQGGTTISNITGQQSTTFGSSVTIPDPNIPTGFGVHINIQEPTTTTTSSSSTTTSSQSSTVYSSQGTTTVNNGMNSGQTTAVPVTSSNCTVLLEDIDGLMVRVEQESFDSDRKEMVKNELAYKCLSSDQGFRILNAFSFEQDRLELAKFMYVKLTDRQNGSKFNELFTFDATKKDFKTFMQNNP